MKVKRDNIVARYEFLNSGSYMILCWVQVVPNLRLCGNPVEFKSREVKIDDGKERAITMFVDLITKNGVEVK